MIGIMKDKMKEEKKRRYWTFELILEWKIFGDKMKENGEKNLFLA